MVPNLVVLILVTRHHFPSKWQCSWSVLRKCHSQIAYHAMSCSGIQEYPIDFRVMYHHVSFASTCFHIRCKVPGHVPCISMVLFKQLYGSSPCSAPSVGGSDCAGPWQWVIPNWEHIQLSHSPKQTLHLAAKWISLISIIVCQGSKNI